MRDARELTGLAFEMVQDWFPEAADLAVTIDNERDDDGYVRTHVTIAMDLIEPMGDKCTANELVEQAARAVACRLKQRGWIPADCDEARGLRDALGLGPDPMGDPQ